MLASEIAKLIIEIEEAVNLESRYYGRLVTWWEQDRSLSHYGIGLSNTHFFNLGTADVRDLQVLKRHDITEQRNLDIRVISDIRSPFEADEIIERLKYALRWLNDLPEDSSNQSIGGKALTGLIFKDNEEWKHQENEPIRTEIDYKNYLKLQSPSLSEIAKLIVGIEEAVNPESGYYGKIVTWWEQDRSLCHYGIGLSDTHLFNLGTADVKNLQVLKRHDVIKQRDLDVRVISDIRSTFEADEIIERLKYALRWLHDLPEDSSNQSISGKALTGLIFKDNEKWRHQENEPIHNEVDYKSYLKRQSPSLKHSRFSLTKKGKIWANIFVGILVILTFAIVVLTDNISIPWFDKDGYQLLKNLLSLLVILLGIVVLISIPNLISSFKWSGFQKKSFWDWLQLLVVPLMLAFGAFYLNSTSEARDKELADKRQQQEIVKDYFSKMQSLILEEKKIRISETPSKQIEKNYYSKKSSSSKDQQELLSPELSPESRSIAKALTFAVLDEVDGSRKGKVIAYLAEAGLIRQPTPVIPLTYANLRGIVLEDVTMDRVMINTANMTEANMTNVTFRNSDIRNSILSNSILKNVNFNGDQFTSTMADRVNFRGSSIIDGNFNDTNLTGSNFDGATLRYTTEEKAASFKNLILNTSNFSDVCFNPIPKIVIGKEQDWLNSLRMQIETKKEQDWLKEQVNDKKIIKINPGEPCNIPVPPQDTTKKEYLNKVKPP